MKIIIVLLILFSCDSSKKTKPEIITPTGDQTEAKIKKLVEPLGVKIIDIVKREDRVFVGVKDLTKKTITVYEYAEPTTSISKVVDVPPIKLFFEDEKPDVENISDLDLGFVRKNLLAVTIEHSSDGFEIDPVQTIFYDIDEASTYKVLGTTPGKLYAYTAEKKHSLILFDYVDMERSSPDMINHVVEIDYADNKLTLTCGKKKLSADDINKIPDHKLREIYITNC